MHVLTFNEAIDQMAQGKLTAEAAANELLAPPEGNRQDLPDSEIAAGFKKIISDFEKRYPYVDSAWVERIGDELKAGADLATIRAAAEQNRGQYIDKARVDAGGSWSTWDAILRALDAQYQAPQP